jgi:hypothetical protein
MGTNNSAQTAASTNDHDLQQCHDEMKIELELINEALAKAGFVIGDETDGEASTVVLAVSAKVDLALAALTTVTDSMAHLDVVLGDCGLQIEGQEPAVTIASLIREHKALTSSLADAQTEAQRAQDAAKNAADALAKRPKAVKGVMPKTLRPCGLMSLKAANAALSAETGDPRSLNAHALLEHIAVAETVELAFSDGAHEIDDVPPMLISGDAWKIANDRLFLTGVDVPMYGASRDMSPFTLAGYGLFLDGELVAYSERINGPLVIAPGSTHSLNGDVVFG